MPTEDVQIKSVPAVRLAQLSGEAKSFEPTSIGPVIGRCTSSCTSCSNGPR